MNCTFKLLAVALTVLASVSLDLHAQSTLDSQLDAARKEANLFSMESQGACRSGPEHYSGSEEPYADAEAYQVYSALIPELPPNPETKTWFIRIDTVPIRGSLDDQARKLWKQTRGADTALDDYYKVNGKIWLLQRKFTLPNPYRLVTREQLKEIFPNNFRRGFLGNSGSSCLRSVSMLIRPWLWSTCRMSVLPHAVAQTGHLLCFGSIRASGKYRARTDVGFPKLFCPHPCHHGLARSISKKCRHRLITYPRNVEA